MKTTKEISAGPIPLVDLGQEFASIQADVMPVLEKIFLSGSYILGENTQTFERELAAYCGIKHAVALNSGTDAILLALRALDIKAGDEVIVPVMTFIATAEPIVQLGATPIFVDVDPIRYTLDPQLVRQKITSRTKAIIAVHLYGQPADMTALQAIAREKKIALIEDMAQALGARYEDRSVGQFSDIACVSFFPTKNLGACGDGGAVLTSSDRLAERVALLRNHGAKVKYRHEEIGYTSRLDEIQAAILRVKLPRLDAWNDRRRKIADFYAQKLAGLSCQLPTEAVRCRHIYHLYTIMTDARDALREALASHGITASTHYPTPLHLQPSLAFLGGRTGQYPIGERLCRQTLSLPLYPQMTDAQAEQVAHSVRGFFGMAS